LRWCLDVLLGGWAVFKSQRLSPRTVTPASFGLSVWSPGYISAGGETYNLIKQTGIVGDSFPGLPKTGTGNPNRRGPRTAIRITPRPSYDCPRWADIMIRRGAFPRCPLPALRLLAPALSAGRHAVGGPTLHPCASAGAAIPQRHRRIIPVRRCLRAVRLPAGCPNRESRLGPGTFPNVLAAMRAPRRPPSRNLPGQCSTSACPQFQLIVPPKCSSMLLRRVGLVRRACGSARAERSVAVRPSSIADARPPGRLGVHDFARP